MPRASPEALRPSAQTRFVESDIPHFLAMAQSAIMSNNKVRMMDTTQSGTRVQVARVMAMPGARQSSLLAVLNAETLETFLASASMARFGTRDTISTRHAPDDALHVLLEGAAIEKSWPTDGGTSAYVRPLPMGELIGLPDVLAAPQVHREIRALLPSVTLRVSGASVRALMASSAPIAGAMAHAAVRSLRSAELDRVVLTTLDAMSRVTYRIMELARTWGTIDIDGEGVTIELPLTQEQLGASRVRRPSSVCTRCGTGNWSRPRDAGSSCAIYWSWKLSHDGAVQFPLNHRGQLCAPSCEEIAGPDHRNRQCLMPSGKLSPAPLRVDEAGIRPVSFFARIG
jgi:CRP-like cAMP-binding protein